MSKLGAIARYEVIMAWRRRSLPIVWVLLFVGVISFALLITSVSRQQPVITDAVQRNMTADAPEWAQNIDLETSTNTLAIIQVMIAGMVFNTIGVTLLMGEVIPLDRQFNVRELLDTLAITRVNYLGGKLFGAWGGLLLGALLIGMIVAFALRLIIGVYDLRVFVALWVAMLIPTSLIASATSVLLSSFVGSRRAAVMVGLAIMPVVLVLVTLAVPSFAGIGALIEPIYAVGILLLPGEEANAEVVSRIGNTLMIYAVALVGVWTLAWVVARREMC